MIKRMLTILGDASHGHDLLLSSLKDILKDDREAFQLEDLPVSALSEKLSTNPMVVIISKMNPYTDEYGQPKEWLTQELEDKLIEYVREGGSLFMWHSGLYGYAVTGRLVEMLGGHFRHRPPNFLLVRYTTVAGTPMTDEVKEMLVQDEHFLMDCEADRVHIFMNSVSEGGDTPAGWYREEGKGKICCITAPHPAAVIANADLKKVIGDSLRWCAKK